MIHFDDKELIEISQIIEEGKLKEAYQAILELEQKDDLSNKEKISCKLIKANLFRVMGQYLESIEYAETVFQESQKGGDILSSFDALTIQAHCYTYMVDIIKSEELYTQAQEIFKIIKERFSIDLRERESFLVRIKAGINFFKGDIKSYIKLNEEAYDLAKNTKSENLIASSLNNLAQGYFHLKEYDKAIQYAKEAVKIGKSFTLAYALGTLIDIYLGMGDINEAKANLGIFHDHAKELGTERYKTLYNYSKASVLKASLRARDRIKSEDIFLSIALDHARPSEQRIDAILSLCDLYITELRITNDPEIINEIHPYIQELLNIAKKQHSRLYLAETLLLQAKLSLLTLDIKETKRFLNQGQKIAELYGIKQLAMRISNEHDNLLSQEKIWENFKQSKVPFSERLELAGLNQQMDYMTRRRISVIPQQPGEEPVLLLLLSEGGVPFFSYTFGEDRSFKSHLFGGFLTTIDYFIREMFSEGLDRAIFGDYTLVMKSVTPFFVSYIFKGNSYYALQKADNFIDTIKNNEQLWKKLLKYFQANQAIQLNDIPQLDSLINEVFITK
ncbi:MAG: tetratricopeptide repeat protein [Candidatus Lokiarchaeota archaeon]|nr:tetratricopeptide repeat protein [Candidatus Lokiarchaeota archaeon]